MSSQAPNVPQSNLNFVKSVTVSAFALLVVLQLVPFIDGAALRYWRYGPPGIPNDLNYSGHYYSQGENTLTVPIELHTLNRKRLCESLLKKISVEKSEDEQPKYNNSVIMLQGGEEIPIHYSDVNYMFRQESYFHWAFGVLEPDWYGGIQLSTCKAFLFMPRLPESYATWEGQIYSPKYYKARYAVDDVYYSDEIADHLKKYDPSLLLTLNGKNTDSGYTYPEAKFDGIENFQVDNDILFPLITDLRVHKTPFELEVLRYTNKITSKAHQETMKRIKPGMKEYQLESIFRHYCYYMGGARHVSYIPICASGPNGAIIHYGHSGAPNDKTEKEIEMNVFDMGCEYYGYASDVTCSFPTSGKFTNDQKTIYEAVLKASRAVIEAAKPGVSWVDMQDLAYRTELKELKKVGLVKGDVEEMIKANVGALFMPHGLGHLMGLDMHDVGGYLEGYPSRPKKVGFDRLRSARKLEEGMVITIEPGIYFNAYNLNKAFKDPKQSKFLIPEAINRFKDFGGVRIEDDCIVTKDGIELMSDVPRTVEEIEKFMAEGHTHANCFDDDESGK